MLDGAQGASGDSGKIPEIPKHISGTLTFSLVSKKFHDSVPQEYYASLPFIDWEKKARGDAGETINGRLTGPVQFIRKLMHFWRLDEMEVVFLLGFGREDIEYISDILDRQRLLRGRDIRDRIGHLLFIRKALWSLFRDLDVENDWLRERHSILGDKSPLSLMLEGSMENLLLAREYVESAAGIR